MPILLALVLVAIQRPTYYESVPYVGRRLRTLRGHRVHGVPPVVIGC
jgi:hypothetical protein